MGTLSKSIGSYGGFITGSKKLIELIHNKARSLIYTTGLPPATIAASLKSMEIISKNNNLTKIPLNKAKLFCKNLNWQLKPNGVCPGKIAGIISNTDPKPL